MLHLDLFILGPLCGGVVQDRERLIDLAQAEQRVAEEGVDERRITLGHERQLPRADGVLIAAACGVTRSEIEGRREELRVEPQRFPESCRGWFELASRIERQAREEGSRHRCSRRAQRLDGVIEAASACVLDDRFRIRLAPSPDVQALHEEGEHLRCEDRGALEALGARGEVNIGRPGRRSFARRCQASA